MLKKSVLIGFIVAIAIGIIVLILIITRKCCFTDQCLIPYGTYQRTPVFFKWKDRTFVYPQNDEVIIVQRGESLTIGCPGSKLNIGVVHTEITCITETYFIVLDDNMDITTLFCEDQIESSARYTGRTCESNGREIEIGFDFGTDGFMREMRICFDDKNQNTLYSEHILTSQINYHENLKRRSYFQEGKFYNLGGKDLYQLYDRPVQRSTINKQLGLATNSTEVISNGSSFFLSRGHLAPKGDFFYASQQNASFYYVNSAPQWEIINSKSWNNLEWRIRSFVNKRNNDLRIFTGTYGILTLDNYSLSPLYLYYEKITKGIPVPKNFWKVVYDEDSRMAVAFVGTNNPYLKKGVDFYCEDMSKSLKWIKINNKNMTQGYIYACEVNELRKKITYIPELNVTGLLSE